MGLSFKKIGIEMPAEVNEALMLRAKSLKEGNKAGYKRYVYLVAAQEVLCMPIEQLKKRVRRLMAKADDGTLSLDDITGSSAEGVALQEVVKSREESPGDQSREVSGNG